MIELTRIGRGDIVVPQPKRNTMANQTNPKRNDSDEDDEVGLDLDSIMQVVMPTAQQSRVIYLTGPITDDSVLAVGASLNALEDTKGDITVRICSMGGSVSAGFAIYDLIRLCKHTVRTEAFGAAESIAALILQAGDKRYMSRHTRLMIHANSMAMAFPASSKEYQVNADEMELLNMQYCKCLAQKSKLSALQLREMCNKDTYFSAHEALKKGLIDGILK